MNLALEFQAFLSGHWQKELPKTAGIYKTATREGWAGPDIRVHTNRDTGDTWSTEEWEGWWWSVPTPPLPRPPKWED